MDKITAFNKEEFANLLNMAKGERSINQYAAQTSVSTAHISRLLRSLLEAPPSPETIAKLVYKACNKITYRDLMVAAGHILVSDNPSEHNYSESNSIIEPNSPFGINMRRKDLDDMLSFVIYTSLNNAPFEWSLKRQDHREGMPDMIIDIGGSKEEYNKWLIFFRSCPERTFIMNLQLSATYGSISRMELLPSDKIVIVVNSESTYNKFLRNPPMSLKSNLFIMFIDLDQKKIIKEEKLCDY